jgi:hypothetical protein
MGLNLIMYKKPKTVIDFDVEVDYDEAAHLGPDERLLTLMSELGTKNHEYITFTKDQLNQLITMSESIDDGTINTTQEYAKRYSNETMLEFYQRWSKIIHHLKNHRDRTNWKKEHLLVYISC